MTAYLLLDRTASAIPPSSVQRSPVVSTCPERQPAGAGLRSGSLVQHWTWSGSRVHAGGSQLTMAEVAPAGAKEVDQRPNTHDPFWDSQNDILKTYSFNYEALTAYKQKLHRSEMLGAIFFPPALICGILSYP